MSGSRFSNGATTEPSSVGTRPTRRLGSRPDRSSGRPPGGRAQGHPGAGGRRSPISRRARRRVSLLVAAAGDRHRASSSKSTSRTTPPCRCCSTPTAGRGSTACRRACGPHVCRSGSRSRGTRCSSPTGGAHRAAVRSGSRRSGATSSRPYWRTRSTRCMPPPASRPYLDLTRVGIRGWSYGGALAVAAVLRRPEVFHAAVAGAPAVDRGSTTRTGRSATWATRTEHPEALRPLLAAPTRRICCAARFC